MATSHLAANLALLQTETDRLVRTVTALDADDLRAPTLCPGWSRAHVVTHVARNADALDNLLHWARTGERTEAYGSPEERDRAIEEGARRAPAVLLADLRDSAERFADHARDLHGPAGQAEVVTRTGNTVRGEQVPTMRLLEVVFHHVDLQAGYGFADADAGFVSRSLRQAVRRAEAAGLDLVLRTPDGQEWVAGSGDGQLVTGSAPDLLLWLARGVPRGLRHEGRLPEPPPFA
jgi:maleylpyruvate isomerase